MKIFSYLLILCAGLVSQTSVAELTHEQDSRILEDQIVYLPVPPPPPPPPPAIIAFVVAPSTEQFAEIQKAIANTNALRAEKGLPALRYDENLSAYAQFRASEVAQKFSHERPNGQQYKDSMQMGRAVGENIAGGRQSADDAILQFKNSPKHYKTLMHDGFTKIGMGTVYIKDSPNQYYWVQIFGADNTLSAYAFEQASGGALQVNLAK